MITILIFIFKKTNIYIFIFFITQIIKKIVIPNINEFF